MIAYIANEFIASELQALHAYHMQLTTMQEDANVVNALGNSCRQLIAPSFNHAMLYLTCGAALRGF